MLSVFLSNRKEKEFQNKLQTAIGFKPKKLSLYFLAFTHSSSLKTNQSSENSNERLEFLGDTVLDSIVAEFLFKKFPYKNEGFLTDVKSRIVKRESLNKIAQDMKLDSLIIYDNQQFKPTFILGNALEALIGAVFLDKGYNRTKKFVIEKILTLHIDVDEVVNSNDNFKSLVLEWANKEGHQAFFETEEINSSSKINKKFESKLYINNEQISIGSGNTKKKAEQNASENASLKLNLNK